MVLYASAVYNGKKQYIFYSLIISQYKVVQYCSGGWYLVTSDTISATFMMSICIGLRTFRMPLIHTLQTTDRLTWHCTVSVTIVVG